MVDSAFPMQGSLTFGSLWVRAPSTSTDSSTSSFRDRQHLRIRPDHPEVPDAGIFDLQLAASFVTIS